MSDETKLKISKFQKHRKRKPHSKLTKAKMSKIAKGRDMSKAIQSSVIKNRGKQSHNIRAVILNNNKEYSSITVASKKTDVGITSIHNNLKGLSKSTKVGVWEYQLTS